MKKEYLILVALILVFSAYLLFHKENRDHTTLPEIKKIDVSKITGVIIDKKPGPLQFTKKDKTWTLTDKKYPADAPAVKNMLDTFKTLKLSALVSQKGDLGRYDLDKEKKIQVKLLEGEKTVFEFSIGKTAPTFNHTFVMLSDNQNIYHANGSFRSNFDKTADDFRDKKVLEFKKASIKKITLEKEGVSRTLTAIEPKTKNQKKEDISVTWRSDDGTVADKKQVSDLLSALSFMECETYLTPGAENELEKKDPLCNIHLENGKNITLTLFKGDKDGPFSGKSSMSSYAFAVSPFNGKEIVSTIDTLLGIQKKEEKNKE